MTVTKIDNSISVIKELFRDAVGTNDAQMLLGIVSRIEELSFVFLDNPMMNCLMVFHMKVGGHDVSISMSPNDGQGVRWDLFVDEPGPNPRFLDEHPLFKSFGSAENATTAKAILLLTKVSKVVALNPKAK